MSADLTARALSAVTVEEECDVIDDFVAGQCLKGLAPENLLALTDGVRAGLYPRPVLLGVVAALVPEGWVIRCEPRFHDDGECIKWIAYALRPHWDRWHPDDEKWIDLVKAEADSELAARLIVTLKAATGEASHAG